MNPIKRLKRIWMIALPIVIQGIVFQLQSLTDKAFLGNVDTKYISALGAAQFPYSTTMDTVVALTTGLVIYVAQLYGAHKKEKVNQYIKSSIFFGSCISIVLFFLWHFFAESILTILNVDTGILPESAQYIRICSASLLLLGMDSALQAMLQGMGNTRPIMVAGILKVGLNILISYVLIFGYCGFPAMNITGAAIGTLAANITSSVLLALYCFLYKMKEYDLHKDTKSFFNFTCYREVIHIGLPAAMEFFLWNASNLVLIAFLNSLSYKATAVYTLTFGIEVVIYAFFSGTSKTAMILMGQEIGARQYPSADCYLKLCMAVNAIIVLLAGVTFGIFSDEILGIFTEDSNLIKLAAPYLIFTAVIMFPKSLNVVMGNGIRAYGDTKWMLYSQIIGSVFVISCSFVLVQVIELGITAIYITLFCDEFLRSILNFLYYQRHYGLHAKHEIESKLQFNQSSLPTP